ncbi:MAG TPA: hypothetical protein VME68_05920 [Acidobacteriaceae bacterium]|nr:hypothetical protein [Acidobacteriaceae bacterium]
MIRSADLRPPTVPGRAGDVGIRFVPPPQLASAAAFALLLFALIAGPSLVWRSGNSNPDFGREK